MHLDFSEALTKEFSLIVREEMLEGGIQKKGKKGNMYFTVGLPKKVEAAKSEREERLPFWCILQN